LQSTEWNFLKFFPHLFKPMYYKILWLYVSKFIYLFLKFGTCTINDCFWWKYSQKPLGVKYLCWIFLVIEKRFQHIIYHVLGIMYFFVNFYKIVRHIKLWVKNKCSFFYELSNETFIFCMCFANEAYATHFPFSFTNVARRCCLSLVKMLKFK